MGQDFINLDHEIVLLPILDFLELLFVLVHDVLDLLRELILHGISFVRVSWDLFILGVSVFLDYILFLSHIFLDFLALSKSLITRDTEEGCKGLLNRFLTEIDLEVVQNNTFFTINILENTVFLF